MNFTCRPRRKLFDASSVLVVTRSIGVAKPQQTNMLATPPDAFGSAYKSRNRGMQRDSPPSPTCVEKIRVWLPVSPFAKCLLRRPLVDRSILKMPLGLSSRAGASTWTADGPVNKVLRDSFCATWRSRRGMSDCVEGRQRAPPMG